MVKCLDRTGIIATIPAACFVIYKESDKLRKTLCDIKFTSIFATLIVVLAVIGYYIKKDSADGRFLIWKVTSLMIADRPLFGWGPDGFTAHYMEYQSRFFTDNPDPAMTLLADNVSHSFNIFLMILVCFGLIGLILYVICVIFTFRVSSMLPIHIRHTIQGVLIVLFIWSLTSYPWRIPFVWIIVIGIYSIILNCIKDYNKKIHSVVIVCIPTLLLLTVSVLSLAQRIPWIKAQQMLHKGNVISALEYYHLAYSALNTDKDFLYNYGAVLHHHKYYDESIEVLQQCKKYINDYDVQMLLASNYQQIDMADSAIIHYQTAADMIPNRFLPLYWQMCIYIDKKDSLQAMNTAQKIINKPAKNKNSASVKRIIQEVKLLLGNTELGNLPKSE